MKQAILLPGSTIGVLGGGQLGRMLALEARPMGYRVLVLDPNADAPAAQIADEAIVAPLDDADAVRELGRRSDVVTFEWENAAVEPLRELAERVPLRPGPEVLAVAQHRGREKDTARRLGLPTAPYRLIRSWEELRQAIGEIGTPAVLKTTRGGYDAKGQATLSSPADAEAAYARLISGQTELILEAWIDFRMELSVICARTEGGEMRVFPVGENVHRNGILESTAVPARIEESVAREAGAIGEAMAEGLGVVGVIAVELFLDKQDRLLVNEIAPRPHNSGHYTIEGCCVSQFGQQLRAACNLPLGSTELLRPSAMVNLLGEEIGTGEWLRGTGAALADPAVALHLYGKREARPGRKMGHLTVLGDSTEDALLRAHRAKQRLIDAHSAAE